MLYSLGSMCIVQSNIKWDVHVKNVCKKVAERIFMLNRLSLVVSKEVFMVPYYAHLQSHIYHAILVWGNESSDNLVLQKIAVRTICQVASKTHCGPLFRQLGILTVLSIFVLECLL